MSNSVKSHQDNVIYFGEYPQTIKADNVDITTTMDPRGYYLGSDGAYYAKVIAKPDSDDYKFSTGADVQQGVAYYFRVEPIRWRILKENDGGALVICDGIIATHRYDDDSNNYAKSEIRSWLNNEFYRMAFDSAERELIEMTEVENDGGDNTTDRVFLLSVAEATTAYNENGFDEYMLASDPRRCGQTSDYARATGAWMDTDSEYYGNGCWWLRSAGINPNSAADINFDGSVSKVGFCVEYGDIAVRPAMELRYLPLLLVFVAR